MWSFNEIPQMHELINGVEDTLAIVIVRRIFLQCWRKEEHSDLIKGGAFIYAQQFYYRLGGAELQSNLNRQRKKNSQWNSF